MKNNINETHRKCFDINVQYLTYIFDTLRSYNALYNLLQTSPIEAVAVQHIYDSQSNRWAGVLSRNTVPLRVLSLPEFMKNVPTFHKNDKFAISLANDKCIIDTQLDADILLGLLKIKVSGYCHSGQKPENASDVNYTNALDTFADKYGFTPKDIKMLNSIFDKTYEVATADDNSENT